MRSDMSSEINIISKNRSDQPRPVQTKVRSAEVQEILSSVPNWMIRWGSCLILVLILMLLYLSWLIKYPEVVHGDAMLTTLQPPVRLYSKSSGYVSKILIENDSMVSEGQLIAQIDNPVKKSAIDSLSRLLTGFNYTEYNSLLAFLKDMKPLGQSQAAANSLYQNLLDYEEMLNDKYYNSLVGNLEEKIVFNGRLAWIAKQEIDLYKIEFSQAREKFEADSILYLKKVIPKHTFYKNRNELIAAKQKVLNSKKSYVQYKIAASDFIKQKNEVIKNFELKKQEMEADIKTSINSINNYINTWQENYLIEAPIHGRLSYLDNITEKSFITPNYALFAIIPPEDKIVAVIKTLGMAYGKIELGQKVRLKLQNYPSHEYGQVIGVVKSFSQLAGQDGYIVKVELVDGLKTTYKKTLQYSPEMKGRAEIITADLRFIERILYSFRKIFERK